MVAEGSTGAPLAPCASQLQLQGPRDSTHAHLGFGRRRRRAPPSPPPPPAPGAVGDTDLVQMSIMEYDSPESSGSQCQGLYSAATGECILLPPYALRSGPRRQVYQDPAKVTAAIVTCGGLCPGLNDVVQNIVYQLSDYGVPEDQVGGRREGGVGCVCVCVCVCWRMEGRRWGFWLCQGSLGILTSGHPGLCPLLRETDRLPLPLPPSSSF